MPAWLSRIVWEWSEAEASIVTFNYDTLLETSTSSNGLVSNWADLYGAPLAPRAAPGDHSMFGTEGQRGRLYTLFKLHGSTNWRFGGLEAPPADRIVLTREAGNWPQPPSDSAPRYTVSISPTPPSPGRHRFMYADLEAMIVPPTGTKATYYGNRSIRAQWRTAFKTLGASDHLLVFGYSFPKTDQVIRSFMSTANFQGTVTVVDRSAEVADVIQAMLPRAHVDSFDGPDAIAAFVDARAGHVVKWGPRYVEGRHVPVIEVDGVPVWETHNPMSTSSYDEALSAAREEVNHRWPELQTRTDDNHRVPGDGGPFQIAYVHADGTAATV